LLALQEAIEHKRWC